MKCLCNPHAEPQAPREPNCPIHGLPRCDREIERIEAEARAGIGDAHGIFQGLRDWRTEKKMIANERTSLSNGSDGPNSNTKSGDNSNG